MLTTASNDGVIKNWELNLEKGEQKEVFSKKVGKTVWKVGWDPFGNLLCASIMNEDHENESYLYEIVEGRLVEKRQLKDDED